MKIARTLAPTAAPVGIADVVWSAVDSFRATRSFDRVEREIAQYLGASNVFLVSNGKAALTIVLRALHAIRSARRVVIPAYTCFSVPAAVRRAGLEPVLVDVNPSTFDFDEASLRRALESPDILCVVPTHLFGIPSDVPRLRAMAGPDVFIVEDAAQAFGVAGSDGAPLGTAGDVAVFSLGRGKNVTAGGGGFIATSSSVIADRCREQYAHLPGAGVARAIRVWIELAVMSLFIHPRLYWLPAGLPFLGLGETVYEPDFEMTRLAATAAGALRRWRSRLEHANRVRAACAASWAKELGLSSSRSRAAQLRFPLVMPTAEYRQAFVEDAGNAGLGISTMYPSAIHQIPELTSRFAGQRYPGAESLAARLVTVPTHHFVRPEDRSAIRRILENTSHRIVNADSHPAPASC